MRELMLIAVIFAACDVDDEPDARIQSKTPAEVCIDVAVSFGNLCERCEPGTYASCYLQISDNAYGHCSDVVAIRNETELYNVCFPWTRSVSCSEPVGVLDPSCQGQLIYP
jgi:hypothetical protein